MTVNHVLERFFWVLPSLLQAIIATVMLIRGLYRQLPYFFSYTVAVIMEGIALSIMANPTSMRFYTYWGGEIVTWALGMAVIYEIYATLLTEYSVLQKAGALLFWIVGAILVLIASWTAFNAPGSDTFRLMQGALTLERSVRIVQCGLLVILFIFASFFGLSWKNYLFGIALGFAIFVSVELAVVAIRAYAGTSQNHFYRWLKPGSYDLAIVVWAVYIMKSWRLADLRVLPKTELAAWNETLQELLHR
jgi:hypothetical protein